MSFDESLRAARPTAIHDGDLRATGLWVTPPGGLVVRGDLVVDDLVTGGEELAPWLAVEGTVRCRRALVVSESTTLIGGGLEVAHLLWAASRDGILRIYGPVRIGAAISGVGTGWGTSFHDQVRIDALMDTWMDGRTRSGHQSPQIRRVDLWDRLVPEVVDVLSEEERDLDERVAEARFLAGEPVLREPTR